MKIRIPDRRIDEIVKKVCEPMDVAKFHSSIRVENLDGYWAFIQPVTFVKRDDEVLLENGKASSRIARSIVDEGYGLRVFLHLDPAFPYQGSLFISGR